MASLNEVKRNSLLNASTFSMRSSNNTASGFVICDDGRYKVYENYHDEDYSTIDTSKSINVNASQINITQETNSQYIPFKMPRYWDGIDLMDMLIQIHWKNGKGHGDISEVVNVQYNDNDIVFGWLINDNITAIAGNVQFEITAIGVNEKNEGNAVKIANIPNINQIMKENPNTLIHTSGLDVGLPEGQMGNSEVGHTNIGAGRIVYQDLA